MADFTYPNGALRQNEIFGAIYNMIIGQRVFADPIADGFTSLVDRARIDGSMYGDQYLYYSTDALETLPYLPDTNGQLNVLSVHRNKDIKVQSIIMSVARQIPVTIDNYFSKRAFTTDSVFSDFNGVMVKWLTDTKRVYDQTLYNAYIGTTEANAAGSYQYVDYPAAGEGNVDAEAVNRLTAEAIAEKIANIIIALKDVSRDFNDYGYLRSYDPADIIIVWNSAWVNKLKKVDMPTIFHKDGLIDKFDESNVLPARYFGSLNLSSTLASDGVRALKELYFTSLGAQITITDPEMDALKAAGVQHVFPGDLIPDGATANAGDSYTENPDVICKIMAKDSVPYMSAFQVATEFVNTRNLSENHYLTFAHNELEYLKEKPFITVVAQEAEVDDGGDGGEG